MMPRFPLGRFAEPSEIAEGAIFLISEKASFMTGEDMHINGGSNFSGYSPQQKQHSSSTPYR